eukprot:586640-Rhodomonas_salina.9
MHRRSLVLRAGTDGWLTKQTPGDLQRTCAAKPCEARLNFPESSNPAAAFGQPTSTPEEASYHHGCPRLRKRLRLAFLASSSQRLPVPSFLSPFDKSSGRQNIAKKKKKKKVNFQIRKE